MSRTSGGSARLWFGCLALVMAMVPAAQAATTSVRMAPATPGSVRFTVDVPEIVLSTVGNASDDMRAMLPGFELTGDPGTPPRFQRMITVAVPPLGDVRVSAVGSLETVSENVTLAPLPALDAEGREVAARDAAAYGAAGAASPVGARLAEVTWIRNQRVARIVIEPAAYEPAARRLTQARRVDVNVQVQPLGSIGPAAESDDPFEPVYREVLANYDQGRAWRRPATSDLVRTARQLGLPLERALAQGPPDHSVIFNHSWVKLAVQRPGFYSVNFSTLRSLSQFAGADKIALDSLRLFALPGYPVLPEKSYCDSCDLREIPFGTIDTSDPADPVHHGGPDSLFSTNSDAIYFFAQGPSGWASEYDAAYGDTAYINHPYEQTSYYYLTVATTATPVGDTPLRITKRDVPLAGGATLVTTFPDRQHFEEDHDFWPDPNPLGSTLFWEKWYWVTLSQGGGSRFLFDLPGADTAQPARFRLRQWGLTDNSHFGGAFICSPNVFDHYLDLSVNGIPFGRRSWKGYTISRGGVTTVDTTGTFVHETGNELRLNVPSILVPGCQSRVDQSGLAWFEVYYQRTLKPLNDSLSFRSPGTSGPYHYDVGPFARNISPRLFDVTDPIRPVELQVGPDMWVGAPATGWTLSFEDTASVIRRYRVFSDSIISRVRMNAANVREAPITSLEDNLRGTSNGAEYVVIYYDAFRTAAEALAAARAARLPLVGRSAPFKTKAVPISALYDQFSGGRTDPAAIRNFLRAAFYNWSVRPKFVTLLGDASFDFKNILNTAALGQPGCLIPTYANNYDQTASIDRAFSTDDWMLSVTNPSSSIPDFFGARIPVDDATTALDVVNRKILAYETTAPLGEYRNATVLLADDDMQGNKCDGLGWTHLVQTNDLATLDLPPHEDREYVYLHTFPTGPGNTKPLARQTLKDDLNAGAALFNYVGHGSPVKIADESVFIDSDVPLLHNDDKMFVFVAASCDVGKFDDARLKSLGEGLMVTRQGGAVAVISATERALSIQNADLNRALYDMVFRRDSLITLTDTLASVGQYHTALSTALLTAKLRTSGFSTVNNAKYQLMGDAATALNAPRLWADVALTDAQGAPVTQLQRGQTVKFTGQVLDRPAGTPQPFSGVASLFVEDSAPIDNVLNSPYDFFTDTDGSLKPCATHITVLADAPTYTAKAGPIYHGDVSIENGTFHGSFVVPMDATLGARGRVRAYVQDPGAHSDGVGSAQVPLVTGTAGTTDTQGPRITLGFVGGATSVRPDATLQIDLFDESGILTTGHAPQNSIIVTLDDNTTSRSNATSTFRYAADSYQQGRASFTLPNLSAGHHKVAVSAADNLAVGITASQHRSTATLEFDVVSSTALSITRAYLFPNPAQSTGPAAGGTFVVDAPGDSVNTLVRIYSLTGRVVRDLKRMGGLGQVQLPWDGRDAEGDPLANGTYLFKVYVSGRESDGSSSPREKAAVDGRLVIVNRK